MTQEVGKKAIIVGAGLVGSLWAVYLAKAGYKVTIYERRTDIRKTVISAGKSINLALSNRGWKALDTVGVGDEVRKFAIPMYGRMMHDLEGNLTYQQYGKEDQAIYSVSRGLVNARMMDMAEQKGNATIFFQHECRKVDLEKGIVYLTNMQSQEQFEDQADLVFAIDGAFSAVRYNSMQKLDRFNYSQNFIADGYREILLPANEDGSSKMDTSALHIWPRGRFMMIALANNDNSFTCTLFMPHSDHKYAFDKLKSSDKVNAFFQEVFPDFYDMLPSIAESWENHPLASLAIVRCHPWTAGKVALMGDSAHATVPFYGQGMNAGFEDCTVMFELLEKHGENWPAIFEEYNRERKPDGDALQDLSLGNYFEMRDFVADPMFLLRKKIEAKFSGLYPDKWMPLYSQVTFSSIRYSVALKQGEVQRVIMDQIMEQSDIIQQWDSPEVMDQILSLCNS
jgi:kynurenine 3-monooxygenase